MMNLNKIFKYALMSAASLMMIPSLVSCDDDDNNSGAEPVIRYIRPTSAESADSLLVAAPLGNAVAIIGENLQNIYSIRFNDQDAIVNLAYLTDNAFIVSVPSSIPGDITNKIYITSRSGQVIEYPFVASIPKPFVKSWDLSGLKDGEIAMDGNYFMNSENAPLEVSFAPNLPAEVVAEKSTTEHLVVKFPEGAEEGNCSITSAYGVTTTQFSRRKVIFEGDGIPLSWEKSNGAYCSLASAKKMLITFEGTFAWWVGVRLRNADDADLWPSSIGTQIDWGPDDSTCGGVYVGEVDEAHLSCIEGTDWYICGGTNGSCKVIKIELVY